MNKMNERIKDIASECIVENAASSYWVFTDDEFNRFAELLIWECMDVVIEAHMGKINPKFVVEPLVEHFGIDITRLKMSSESLEKTVNKYTKKLAKKAGFILWQDEDWNTNGDVIDWSSSYDYELEKLVELVVQSCLKECWYDLTPKQIADNIKTKFGVSSELEK